MKKIFFRIILPVIAVAIIAAGGFITGNVIKAAGDSADVMSQGIIIEGIDVSGMTLQQAQEAIGQAIGGYREAVITLDTGNGLAIDVTGEELGVTIETKSVLERAFEYGKAGGPLERYKAAKDLERGVTKNYDLSFKTDSQTVRSLLEARESELVQEAKDYGLTRVNNQFVMTEGQPGIGLDIPVSVNDIVSYVSDWDGKDGRVLLTTKVTQPRGSKEDLEMVTDLLGSYTTSFTTSGAARSHNVENGISRVNGKVLYPGETLSVLQCVSPLDASGGYELAGAYENGATVQAYGGGICQVSSTLYNAVLMAELEIVTRSAHSMVVDYVQPSFDAAIAGDYKDFQFKNSTDYPIYIEGYCVDKHAYFNVYGHETRSASHSVAYENEIMEEVPQTSTFIFDDTQPLGTYKRSNVGHKGVIARLWKITYENGVETERKIQNNSKYNMSPVNVTVGTAGADEGMLASLNAAAATGDENNVMVILGLKSIEQVNAEREAAAAAAAAAAGQ